MTAATATPRTSLSEDRPEQSAYETRTPAMTDLHNYSYP